MDKQRMRYPARAHTETDRQRRARLALQRKAAQDGPIVAERVEPVAILKSSGELVMPFATFQGGDYGQLCHFLGLRPSMPKANAQRVARRAAA